MVAALALPLPYLILLGWTCSKRDMDDSRVAKCTYGAGTLMLILSSTTTFDWVSNELCSRFKLKLGNFELRCSFTDCSNCLLESDDDVKIMFMVVPNNDSFAQDEDTCKDSSQTSSIFYSSAASSCCLSMNFDGISRSEFEGGVCEFRDKLAKYAIENGFKMKHLKNEPRRVTAVCDKKESNGCEWHVHAVKSNNLNNVYSCSGLIHEKINKAMGSRLVSSIVKDKVRSNPLVRPIELITDLRENYGLDIPYHVAWYGKESATKDLHGDEKLSYAHLPWYVYVLKASNVGSHCVLNCGEDGSRFQQIFICFKASIDGFRWCRPMLFIDGTFITNKCKGTLLRATAKNGNKASDGVVIRDHTGILLDGITHCFQSLSAVQAECHVIRSGLEMAYVRGFTNVIVETDFKVCFAAVREDISVSNWTLYPILYDIRMLKASFSSLRWAWTTRDANHAADWVASQARRGLCAEAWVIRPPTALVYILSRDGLPCPPN
ncbi:unnamed protein product [Prunus armeniaca]